MILDFILKERILAITVIASIITFQFISTFKVNLVDPLLDFILPNNYFENLNLVIRPGYEPPSVDQKQLTLDFGESLREFIKWIFVIFLLFILVSFTSLQNIPHGNPGVAIM